MLSRTKRINRELLTGVLSRGISMQTPYFSGKILRLEPSEQSRFAFIVSKKVAKTAIRRNLIRRRGYGAIKSLKIERIPGFAVALVVKKEAADLPYSLFEAEIKRWFSSLQPPIVGSTSSGTL